MSLNFLPKYFTRRFPAVADMTERLQFACVEPGRIPAVWFDVICICSGRVDVGAQTLFTPGLLAQLQSA